MLEHAIRMKERVGSASKLRNYDTDGYIKRAGCICFRTNHAKEILLVTSNRYPDKWIVPAGGVEAGERFQDAAVREVFEEVSRLCAVRTYRSPGVWFEETFSIGIR